MQYLQGWLWRATRPGVDSELRGSEKHQEAVRRLQASYDAIAPGSPVRLAKRTSNLFRPRDELATAGLDVSGLDGVVAIDPVARTADVQGMCTYEDLVDATLPHGLIPLVVPQLRTITLGGAVTGLGIESTSFRSGLPHESVLEMDIFTGGGEVVTARPDNEHAELFATFPNSYGSLGYATRLRIELEPVRSHVALRHVRFSDTAALQDAIATVTDTGEWHGEHVDAMDGTAFEPGEYYLTLARWVDGAAGDGSDYAGQEIYWRSIQQREIDLLTTYDYLWRWDTDWFWCSRAFGAQHPVAPPDLAAPPASFGHLPPARRARPPLRDHGPDPPPHRAAAARARGAGRGGSRREARRVPRLVRRQGRHAACVAVPAAPPGRRHVADVPTPTGAHVCERRFLGRSGRR